MVNLQVKRTVKLPVEKSILLNTAQTTLDLENVSAGSVISIVIADDALLKKLNQEYRNIDAPTDVLSFPASEHDPDTQTLYLGDVIISLARAQEQAQIGGHPLVEELQLLVVHGILHLVGYDHLDRADRKKMQVAQDKVLKQLGVRLIYNL